VGIQYWLPPLLAKEYAPIPKLQTSKVVTTKNHSNACTICFQAQKSTNENLGSQAIILKTPHFLIHVSI
jgi:hypothetical protein